MALVVSARLLQPLSDSLNSIVSLHRVQRARVAPVRAYSLGHCALDVAVLIVRSSEAPACQQKPARALQPAGRRATFGKHA